MRCHVLSPRAQADIADIWDYTVGRWGIDQAELYLRQIQAGIEAVAAEPGLGASCDYIRTGYRKSPVGSHMLFYRIVDDGIDVVRVLHRRMDFGRHL
jgi:toxin ParE1/3/4